MCKFWFTCVLLSVVGAQPERGWEVDLEHCGTLVDERTKAIIVNNPSNPCGSNYSKEHLLALIAFANKHRIPIISDEVYGTLPTAMLL